MKDSSPHASVTQKKYAKDFNYNKRNRHLCMDCLIVPSLCIVASYKGEKEKIKLSVEVQVSLLRVLPYITVFEVQACRFPLH